MADLTPIPMGIPWDPWDPSLPHSQVPKTYPGSGILGGVLVTMRRIAQTEQFRAIESISEAGRHPKDVPIDREFWREMCGLALRPLKWTAFCGKH